MTSFLEIQQSQEEQEILRKGVEKAPNFSLWDESTPLIYLFYVRLFSYFFSL